MINADGNKGMNRGIKKIRNNLKINQICIIKKLKESIPERYRDVIIIKNNKYVVFDEVQADILGKFDCLWQAILYVEKYNREVLNKKRWNEEFEDILAIIDDDYISLYNKELPNLIRVYLKIHPMVSKKQVKFQCRDGEIRITNI